MGDDEPTREELLELAALGIAMSISLAQGNYGNANFFASGVALIAQRTLSGGVPAWMDEARERVRLKIEACRAQGDEDTVTKHNT